MVAKWDILPDTLEQRPCKPRGTPRRWVSRSSPFVWRKSRSQPFVSRTTPLRPFLNRQDAVLLRNTLCQHKSQCSFQFDDSPKCSHWFGSTLLCSAPRLCLHKIEFLIYLILIVSYLINYLISRLSISMFVERLIPIAPLPLLVHLK